MPFTRSITALRWERGQCSVVASEHFDESGEVDWAAFERAHPLKDISADSGYQDLAVVVNIDQLRPFLKGPRAMELLGKLERFDMLLVSWSELLESGIPDD